MDTGAVDEGGGLSGGVGSSGVDGRGGGVGGCGAGLVDGGRNGVSGSGGAGLVGSGGASLVDGRRGCDNAVGGGALGNAELGAVLVLAGDVVDDLDAVAGSVGGGLEVSGRGPDELAAVGDSLGEGRTELDDVGGGALEEQHGDGVVGGWGPGDGEWLASRHNLGVFVSQGPLFWRGCAMHHSTRLHGGSMQGAVACAHSQSANVPRSRGG